MGWSIQPEILLLQFLLLLHFSDGLTNPKDVAAINSLYAAFGTPKLPGWVLTGGDPCAEAWQGVQCDTTNIISIILVGANLGGGLGNNLGSFTSIKTINLSNNHVGGSIPSSLPVSLQAFFLSDNNFTGSIPSTISSLTSLTALKLNDNHITGELPDAFQSLSNLSTIDFAGNNLTGELPPSMANLSSLKSLHLQANHLSGKLDVLENLPLQDLNIENNSFSGPIPQKVLNIPNFRRDGNPFETPPAPMPSPPSPSMVPSPPSPSMLPSTVSPGAPAQSPPLSAITPGTKPVKQAASPSSRQEPSNQKKMQSSKTKRIVGISIGSVLGVIILILAFLLCMPWCFTKSKEYYQTVRRHGIQPYMGAREISLHNEPFSQPNNQVKKELGNYMAAGNHTVLPIKDEPRAEARSTAAVPKPENEPERYSSRSTLPLRKLDSELRLSGIDIIMPPPPPSPPPPPPAPPPPPSAEKVMMKPIASVVAGAAKPSTRALPLTSVRSFTIASLQQYTNSFSQDNLIGSGMLGSVYRAELPDGKVLAVKKLDKSVCSRQREHEFMELVNDIDKIRHVNIVELVGYCSEHGQRLLIYEHCSNGTLHDELHSNDECRKKLSWNTRMQMALEAAWALEYLHEECEPPVVHRNFKSGNILLDELSIRVSDCGLAPLIASGAVSQLSGQLLSAYGHGAPEFELGVYTEKSDVFSFGVVMLELLTGRMPYDRTRVRGEQFLVRWAVPQLHDIDALQMMIDPSLSGQYMTKSLSFYADVISRCVWPQPEFRPLMSEVVQDLERLLHMQFEY